MKVRWIIVTIILIIAIALNLFQYYRISELSEAFPYTIREIKGSPETYIGRKVTVQGYLVKTTDAYMLIEDLDLLLVNKELLEEQYLLIGDLEKNETQDLLGRLVRAKGTINETKDQVNLDLDTPIPTAVTVVGFFKVPIKYWRYFYDTPHLPFDLSELLYNRDYAVLISGGGNNPAPRYWNDLKLVYSMLVNNYSYNPNRITVIYKDGVGEDTDMPVDYAASEANVTTVFQNLAGTITNQETLFVFTTNHGGGFHPNDPRGDYMYGLIDDDGDEPEAGYSEAAFGTDFNFDGDTLDIHPAVDETLVLYPGGQRMRDDDFAALINGINSERTIIVMEQCFSGGFINELSGNNRIVLTACHEEEFSYGADPATIGNFDEFAYHFAQAINTGNMAADTDNDGKISMQEAFNYASQNDSAPEDPQYDDNGDGVGHQEPIPNGGDGALGDTTFLNP